MTVTLSQLRTQSRQRADMENSEFVTDSELNTYINSSIAELHDLLIAAYDSDYSVSTVSFNTASGTSSYALPNGTNYSAAAELYKLRGVDIRRNNDDWLTLETFNFNERNRTGEGGIYMRYRMVGANLVLSPDPDGTYEVKLWYIPVATKLTLDADTLRDLNQYSEYVVVDAAIKMLQKEESDVSVLMAQKAALSQRITDMAQNRDAGRPESVSDIYAENDYYFWTE